MCSGSKERAIEHMMMKREPALEPASDFRMRALPASPLGQRLERWQIVAHAQLFKEQIRQRRRRLSDHHARMRALLDENNGMPEPARNHCEQRAGKARTNHRNVVLSRSCLVPARFRRRRHSKIRCSRFMAFAAAQCVARDKPRNPATFPHPIDRQRLGPLLSRMPRSSAASSVRSARR
jgi:hypothetical protein